MRRLSSLIAVFCWVLSVCAQSPHGEELKMNCADCHDPKSWTTIGDSIIFDHNGTDFPLEETHLLVDCKACHASLIFEEASSQCITCHNDVHSMTVGNDCARCHSPRNWLVDYIPELHEENGFPLIGSHGTLSCADCHVSETSLRFDRIGNDCLNCHMDDFSSTQSPNHQASGFSTNCIDCHNPYSLSWETDFIDHGFFPLVEGHDIKDCNECHKTGNFSNISPECVSCHSTDYQGTSSPSHTKAGFSTNCVECHNISSWIPSTWDHNNEYPLLGYHSVIANECMLCHAAGYDNTPNTCVGCHLNDYNGTKTPNHKESNFSTECLECHGQNSWIPSSWNHEPLLGYHSTIASECMLCHANGYDNTPTTCIGCHQTDYNNTSTPNHNAAQFSTNCLDCHNENSWSPSTWDHNSFYQFQGYHITIASNCVLCHAGGFINTPNTCVGCHLADYNGATNPNHIPFSTNCVDCHTETSWVPSTFDHDLNDFPIYTGKHRQEWSACTDCHINSSSYKVFSCINCHEHNNKSKVDNDHVGKITNPPPYYTYTSAGCYECHPLGNAK